MGENNTWGGIEEEVGRIRAKNTRNFLNSYYKPVTILRTWLVQVYLTLTIALESRYYYHSYFQRMKLMHTENRTRWSYPKSFVLLTSTLNFLRKPKSSQVLEYFQCQSEEIEFNSLRNGKPMVTKQGRRRFFFFWEFQLQCIEWTEMEIRQHVIILHHI